MLQFINKIFTIIFSLVIINNVYADPSAGQRKCGVIAALTGPMSKIGIGIKNSVVIASHELDTEKTVEFIYEDDQFLPKNTVSSMQKLLSEGVSCLIVFGSTNSLAVADMAERAKVPMLSIAISHKVVEGRHYVYRLYIPVSRQVEAISEEVKRRKYETIAIVTSVQDATETLRERFVASGAAKIVLDEEVAIGDLGLNTIATKIAALKPSAVFVNTLPPQNSVLTRQLRSLKYQGDFFGGPPLGNLDEIKAAQGALEKSWFVSISSSGTKQLYAKYEEMFKEIPAPEAVYGYDAAAIIIKGAKGHGINNSLMQSGSFSGLLGEYKLIDHSFDVPAELWQIRGMGWELNVE